MNNGLWVLTGCLAVIGNVLVWTGYGLSLPIALYNTLAFFGLVASILVVSKIILYWKDEWEKPEKDIDRAILKALRLPEDYWKQYEARGGYLGKEDKKLE